MRLNRKKIISWLLLLTVAATGISGCQPTQVADEQQTTAEQQSTAEQQTAAEQQAADSQEGEKESVENKDEGKTSELKEAMQEAHEPEKVEIAVEDYEGWNNLLQENKISEEFQKGMDDFAYESASAVLREERGNGNYSPLSLYYALALAGCGADGETSSEIMKQLGVQDQEELAEQCRKLYQWYAYYGQREQEEMEHYGMDNYRSTIQLGNSLWISNRLNVNKSYQQLAAEKFFASSYGVDFENPETGERMGAWIAEKTNGVLKPQLSPDSSTLLAILNTLYFYGGWANPFAEERTADDVFVREDGSEVMVPYLNQTEDSGTFKKGDGYTLSFLRTNNGCRVMFLLPDEGRTIDEFLESPERLRAVMGAEEDGWSNAKVIWQVPKFDFGSSYKLEAMLKNMGMERMFGDQAEFSGISSEKLFVSDVIQETHIGVDEQGVEGAAYTMIAMARSALREPEETVEMRLNRPFLFGVQDENNGVWLFLGVCRDAAEK